jgi:hypothetical protein
MFCTAQLILWNDPINLGKILELPEIVHRTLIQAHFHMTFFFKAMTF